MFIIWEQQIPLNGSVMMYGVSGRELLSGIKEDTQAKFRVLKIECGYSRTQFTHSFYSRIYLSYS